MFHFIWSVIVGIVVGYIARAVLPGSDRMGLLATACVGVLGSLIGGLIGNLIKKPAPGSKFHAAGFFMSIVGAVVLLLILRAVR